MFCNASRSNHNPSLRSDPRATLQSCGARARVQSQPRVSSQRDLIAISRNRHVRARRAVPRQHPQHPQHREARRRTCDPCRAPRRRICALSIFGLTYFFDICPQTMTMPSACLRTALLVAALAVGPVSAGYLCRGQNVMEGLLYGASASTGNDICW